MIRRVIGIPDNKGIISVSCGGDIIEIELVGQLPAAGEEKDTVDKVLDRVRASFADGRKAEGSDRPSSEIDKILDKVRTSLVEERGAGRSGSPADHIEVPRTPGGKVDVQQLVRDYLRQLENPNLPDPRAVILGTDAMDVHEVSDLGKQIEREMSGIPLVIDFGGGLKR